MRINRTNKIILGLLTLALIVTLVTRFVINTDSSTDGVSGEAARPAEYNDLIRVFTPLPEAAITSPITITGEARGQWFFEASFPIVVVDANGLIIGEGFAATDGEWMTTDYIPFTATVTFNADTSVSDQGAIILQRNNPSDLPENDDSFEYEVVLVE